MNRTPDPGSVSPYLDTLHNQNKLIRTDIHFQLSWSANYLLLNLIEYYDYHPAQIIHHFGIIGIFMD